MLQFLRKKYQLIDIRGDPNFKGTRFKKGQTHWPFVIVLNHKCSIKPNIPEVKAIKWHPLTMELDLMKRVIVVSEADGIKLNFHPKLRKTPLQFLTIEIEALPIMIDSKYQLNPLIKYTFDLEESTRG